MDAFTSLQNFRDLGGIKTTCGKTIRQKRLLRAAQPVGLSVQEVDKLRAHNLKYIIDFRTKQEVEAIPVDKIDGVIYTHIDIMGKNAAQAACPKFWMKLFRENPDGVEDEFMKTYMEFATSPSSLAGYSAFIKACAAAEEGATLFHCAAGKDRTGFAAAIILKILNVSDEHIFTDYLETRIYQAQTLDYHVNRAKKNGFSNEQIASMGRIFNVKNEYIQAAYNAVDKAFGCFETYVTDGLKICDVEVERLRELYLD